MNSAGHSAAQNDAVVTFSNHSGLVSFGYNMLQCIDYYLSYYYFLMFFIWALLPYTRPGICEVLIVRSLNKFCIHLALIQHYVMYIISSALHNNNSVFNIPGIFHFFRLVACSLNTCIVY